MLSSPFDPCGMRNHDLPLLVLIIFATLHLACGDAADSDSRVTGPVVDGNVRITVLTDTLVRLERVPGGTFEDRPSQLTGARPTSDLRFHVADEGDVLVIRTDAIELRYTRGDGRLSEENVELTFTRGDEEVTVRPVWGNPTPPNALGGWRRSLDNEGTRQALHPGILSRDGWALVDDSATVLLTDGEPGFALRAEDVQDGYLFAYGLDYRQALADLRALTGPAPLLPRKAFGVWYSKYWAYSAAEWRDVVASFRDHDVPLDVISVDTDWKRVHNADLCAVYNAITGADADDPCSWNGWDWNREFFPDPAGFLEWAHDQGLEVGLNIHPSINGSDPAYARVVEVAGELEEDSGDQPCSLLQADPLNPCYIFDWTDPAQLEAYFELHRPIAEDGADFWWLDWCCEGSSAEAPGLNADAWINAAYLAEHRAMGSRWPSFSRIGGSYQRGAELPDDRGVGALAEHRQTLHFTGDTCGTWEMLGFTAEMTVAEGAAIGMPYVSHDIGSFLGPPEGGVCEGALGNVPRLPEDMFVRWTQFGTFQPLDRLHSNHGDRLPWEYPGEPERIASEFLRLRGRLVPHLYTLAREAHDTGVPIARALYLQWPELDDAYAFPMQFTLGDDLLVATVAAPGDPAAVEVWIPPGTWIDYFTGERHEGPARIEASVPLDRYPVYARAGSILPTQPDLPGSRSGPQDDIVLTVWAGGDDTYRLYEDAGRGFDYEDGAYAWTEVVSRTDGGCVEVEIGATDGADFAGALSERSWSVRVVGAGEPTDVRVDGAPVDPGRTAVGRDIVEVQTGLRAAGAATLVEVGCR